METAGTVEDEFAFDTGVSRYPRLNRAATIYGPNGSGKSRLIEALAFMQDFVVDSARETQAGDPVLVAPFRLDVQSPRKPSRLEIAFVQEDTVYEYGFSVDAERVWNEQLSARLPGGRIQRWFSRNFDPSSGEYEWIYGPSFQGARKMWRTATRPNALYVSTAVQLNSDSLRPVIEWFRKLAVIPPNGISPYFTSVKLLEKPDGCERVVDFLRQADIHVSDIRIQEKEMNPEKAPAQVKKILEKKPSRPRKAREIQKVEFGLPVKGTESLAYLDFFEQSDGTQRMYSFALPWLDIIDQDRVVVVDELDRSLHPHLVRFLIAFINRPGKTRAQLVATTHDAALLQDRDVLHRNQVWFTEKGLDQAASLTPLSDYHPRKKESLSRGYLGGRYGAIPNVSDPRLH